MADEQQPSLHIDTDWKRQAQEEKKRLAEQAAAKAAAPAPSGATPVLGGMPGVTSVDPRGGGEGAPAGTGGRRGARRGERELPPASFGTLVQSLMSQALYYLGDLAVGGQAGVNLDMAKHQLDTLNVLEEKTKNNLNEEEQHLLDSALYDVRMRYVNVASQYL